MKDSQLKKIREKAYPINHTLPPTQEELGAKALYYVRTCKPKSYKEMKKDGTLDHYCQLAAIAATNYANSLIDTGESEEQAWNRAIRLEILESETD
jgi:hypothetical protein